MGSVYQMLKAKELVVGVNKVEIPTRLIDNREDVREDAPNSPIVNSHIASLSGTTVRVYKARDRIASVIRDSNIPIPKEEFIRDGYTMVRDEHIGMKNTSEPMDTDIVEPID